MKNSAACVDRIGIWAAFMIVLALLPSARLTLADTGTDEPGSIIVFPYVTSSDTEETLIQLSNAAGTAAALRCFYVNGATSESQPEPDWSVTDFQVKLTALQPTLWTAGLGLPPVPPDMRPAGLYSGPIPPVGENFEGELRCVVVNSNESPVSRNILTGEATIVDRATGGIRKYQATTIQGLPGNNGDNTLAFNDFEYTTCPRILLLNHFFENAPDPVSALPAHTNLTLVPCSMNLEASIPGSASVQFTVINELELRFSASLEVTCFSSVSLTEISARVFNYAVQGTLVGQTRIRAVVDGETEQGHGILGIADEFRGNLSSGASINLHSIGGNLQADAMILPSPF